MDPNATLRRMRDAIRANDLEGIEETAGYLIVWLERGGFIPAEALIKGYDRASLLQYLKRIRFVCSVMNRAQLEGA